MTNQALDMWRRWTGWTPAPDENGYRDPETPDLVWAGDSHVRLPDGTWMHSS